jgi:hypothetical protein
MAALTSVAYDFERDSHSRRPPQHSRRTLTLVTSDGVRERALPSKRRDPFLPQVGHAPEPEPAAAEKRPAQWLRNSAILFSFCLHAAVGLALFGGSDSAEQFRTAHQKAGGKPRFTLIDNPEFEGFTVLQEVTPDGARLVAAA